MDKCSNDFCSVLSPDFFQMVLTYQAIKKDNQISFEPFFLEPPVYEKFSEIDVEPVPEQTTEGK